VSGEESPLKVRPVDVWMNDERELASLLRSLPRVPTAWLEAAQTRPSQLEPGRQAHGGAPVGPGTEAELPAEPVGDEAS
jgi:hypothetical protein